MLQNFPHTLNHKLHRGAILTCFGQKTGELGQAVAGQPREEGRMLSLA
uniref:Uncharacterized protein n=1 Tax=Brugia malayi TaxID=6279 RepID=A8NSZ4_BRUMA